MIIYKLYVFVSIIINNSMSNIMSLLISLLKLWYWNIILLLIITTFIIIISVISDNRDFDRYYG